MNASSPIVPAAPTTAHWLNPITRGLLLREWIAHRRILGPITAVWVIGVWILPLINSPDWMHFFGLWISIRLGTAFGGHEASEGSEEFAFALPATRSQRYLVRLALGLAIVLSLLAVGSAAIVSDAPQRLWSLLVESGLTRPNAQADLREWTGVLVAWPAVFACIFAFAANARTPAGARGASWPAILVALVLGTAGYAVERRLELVSGSVALPLLAGGGYAVLHLGHLLYTRKDGISRPGPDAGSRSWLWLLILFAVIAALLLLGMFVEAHPSDHSP